MTVRAIQAGAADFLTKPFEKEELLSAIRRCFGRYHKFNRQPRINSMTSSLKKSFTWKMKPAQK